MSLPFFYEPTISGPHFTLSEESSRHCIQVLRMKTGGQLLLTDGRGISHVASIVSEDKKKTVVLLEPPVQHLPLTKKISIAISLLKNASRFEWFLEKATEMGVAEIQPLITARTENTKFRTDRLNSIVIAAMIQSQQYWLPVLHEPRDFENVVNDSPYGQKLIAHCENDSKEYLHELPASPETQILIGPEGDFTPAEISIAIQFGYRPVSLGQTRLRTETAGMVATAILINK